MFTFQNFSFYFIIYILFIIITFKLQIDYNIYKYIYTIYKIN